jgi:hypothetical protein
MLVMAIAVVPLAVAAGPVLVTGRSPGARQLGHECLGPLDRCDLAGGVSGG